MTESGVRVSAHPRPRRAITFRLGCLVPKGIFTFPPKPPGYISKASAERLKGELDSDPNGKLLASNCQICLDQGMQWENRIQLHGKRKIKITILIIVIQELD